jgi:hypothetical protein
MPGIDRAVGPWSPTQRNDNRSAAMSMLRRSSDGAFREREGVLVDRRLSFVRSA